MKRTAILIIAALALVAVFAPAAAQDDMMTYTVTLGGNDDLGAFFTTADGFTLYTFDNDEPGVSNCTGGCLENWPALTVADGELPSIDPAIAGVFSVITREDDGTRQVTYNGWPLYTWINDANPGDTTGEGVGDVWWVATMPSVALGGNAELGSFLVDDEGYTLYIFTNDTEGVSNCTGGCLENWPALTVESEDELTVQPGLDGEFGLITREDDGTLQVTFNGLPLYGWINDEAPGDATGQGVGDVWFVVQPTVRTADNEEFGSIFVGPNGMTLYTFSNDADGVSNCYDQCAANWPPAFVTAESTLEEGFSTVERTDGSLQLAYNGAPLYYWAYDVVPGDTTGHNVGDVWFVAQP